jgi:hypothetical protein
VARIKSSRRFFNILGVTYIMENIFYIKLSTGEELIAERVSIGDEKNTYKNIVQVIAIPSDSEISIRIFPFPFAASDAPETQINKNSIVIESIPNDRYIDIYREAFGKIKISRNNLLLS